MVTSGDLPALYKELLSPEQYEFIMAHPVLKPALLINGSNPRMGYGQSSPYLLDVYSSHLYHTNSIIRHIMDAFGITPQSMSEVKELALEYVKL